MRSFKKGDEVEAVVLAIDPERERISLGIKQLRRTRSATTSPSNRKGAIVNGTVKRSRCQGRGRSISARRRRLPARFRNRRGSRRRRRTLLKVGDKVEAKFIGIDRKGRGIKLSIKAKDDDEEQEALQNSTESPTGTSLGDLLKEQIWTRLRYSNGARRPAPRLLLKCQ